MSSKRIRRSARLSSVAVGAILVLMLAGTALAGLSGPLPALPFTFTSTTVNDVNITGNGIHLKT